MTTQEIAYLDVLPEIELGTFQDDVSAAVDVANQQLTERPLHGKTVTIETGRVKIGVDTNAPFCLDGATFSVLHLLRIFYLLRSPAYERIGIADFVPQMLTPRTITKPATYEEFSAVLEEACRWATSQPPEVKVANLQTLLHKLKLMHCCP